MVLDDVLGLGADDDELEANEIFVLAISRANGGEKVVTLGFTFFIDFEVLWFLQGIHLNWPEPVYG